LVSVHALGLVLFIFRLDLLFLLSLLGHWGLDNFTQRFLLFSEPQPGLCHVENDGAFAFKGNFGRKLLALLRSASVLFRPRTRHGHSLFGRLSY
jgi:hypothetical protein